MHSAIVGAREMTRILLHFSASGDKDIELVTTNSSIEDLDILSRLRKLNKTFITVLNKIDKKSDALIKEDLNKSSIEASVLQTIKEYEKGK